VGSLDGAKPRQVLVTKAELESLFGGNLSFPKPDEDEYEEEVPPAEIIPADEEEEDEEEL
jgi:hypothetical protein